MPKKFDRGLAEARRKKVKSLMDQQHLSPKDLTDRMDLSADERRKWQQYVYNVRSNVETVNVTEERASILAKAFGVDPKTILHPDGSLASSQNNGRTQSGMDVLKARMEGRGLTAAGLAQLIEKDPDERDGVSLQIGEALESGQLPSNNGLCERIADVLDMDIKMLSGKQEKRKRYPGRKPGSKNKPKVPPVPPVSSEPAKAASPIAPEPHAETRRLRLEVDDLNALFPNKTVEVIKSDQGYMLHIPGIPISREELAKRLLD